MIETNFRRPLKVGLFTVVTAYFLFTLHALLTISWVGEWESLPQPMGLVIYVEDIGATAGMVFRFIASLTAFVAVVVYFTRTGLKEQRLRTILMIVLVGEAIYWLGLLPSGVMPIVFFRIRQPLAQALFGLVSSDIPCLVESLAIPASLIVLATKLRPTRPTKEAIKWALITGTVYIFVFWLVNTGIWILQLQQKTISDLIAAPEIMVNFVVTIFGLPILSLFAARFTMKSSKVESLRDLNLRTVGAIITFLGLWFLCSYLIWIFFGNIDLWNDWKTWYAWFLGHNLDLWILAIPLVGLPLMYSGKGDVTISPTDSSNL